MIEQVLPAEIFAFLLVFSRIGTAMMIMPAIGEIFVNPRARLSIALAVSLIVMPLVADLLPVMPANPWTLLMVVGGEMLIGAFIGFTGRVLMGALAIAGMIIAYQSSLANAFVNNPVAAEQGALAGAFLTVTALALIFVTNLHHLLISGVIDSYRLFTPGAMPPVGDFSETVARLMSESFLLAMQISAPFLVAGLLFSIGVGLLNRLMPQVQMFFVAMPLQIAMGMSMLVLMTSGVLLWFLDRFESTMTNLFLLG